jgi:hypothetical protein
LASYLRLKRRLGRQPKPNFTERGGALPAVSESANAVGYAQFYSRAHRTVIRIYDEAGDVIVTHDHAGEFKVW